jgi:hypothetical protein
MPNPYDAHEKASEGAGMAGAAAGANTGFPNPMGGVQNAQKAYHMHQYGKIVSQPRWSHGYDKIAIPMTTNVMSSNRRA